MEKQYKTRKRKLKVGRVISVSLIMWLSILGAISLFNPSKASSIDKKEYKNYTVTKGETLWSIAKTQMITNEFYKNKSIEEIIYSIKKNNSLEDDIVYENQQIKIRTY